MSVQNNNPTDTSDCCSVISSRTSHSQNSTNESYTNFDSPQKQDNTKTNPEPVPTHNFTQESQVYWRCFVAFSTISVMFFAKANVPDNPVSCIEDHVLNAFQSLNAWILLQENEFYRSAFLFACGSQIDLIFFSTLLFWVLYGKTGRLPVSSAIFYAVRAIIQAAFWSPYPAGYNWETPGFPSFVAPYGKGSDFFFSGHSGFLVLMANEWNMNGYRKMRNYCLLNLVYTVVVLLVYQAHYSIDIFTGVFFADYVFNKVDYYKENIDGFWKRFAVNVEKTASKTKSKIAAVKLQTEKSK